jgi:DNA repair protein RecN (Recombination protein N)
MLTEIRVRDLGVIEDLVLPLGPGMTALTGETGAGKTLVVEALELLVGGRAEAQLVRAGAESAVVEGRFVEDDGRECVLSRELPANGRSRSYADGRMATAQALSDLGANLVDLHGQHAHQSLLHQGAQRRALDHFAGADTAEVEALEVAVARLDERLAELGGDERSLAREVDLLRFQLGELDAARLEDADEEERLTEEAEVLARAEELRRAAREAHDALTGPQDGRHVLPGAADLVGSAGAGLRKHTALADLADRLAAAGAEIEDVAEELRRREEGFWEDPARLAEVQARRQLLRDLRRKYGESLGSVVAFREEARTRLSDIEAGEARRGEIASERASRLGELEAAERRLAGQRREAAPALASAIEAHLRELALERARFDIEVEGRRGEQVTFLFGANPGEPALPLGKVASGGELARAMLAIRLVLSEAPPTLVFDEVDAGVGGAAALAVGAALAELARDHQVLVVTHLAQVAAFADAQVAVHKEVRDGRTVATARVVAGEDRVRELSRMLSGRPDSATARQHAEELLATARRR